MNCCIEFGVHVPGKGEAAKLEMTYNIAYSNTDIWFHICTLVIICLELKSYLKHFKYIMAQNHINTAKN